MLTSFPALAGVARTGPELLSGRVGGVGGEGVGMASSAMDSLPAHVRLRLDGKADADLA